MMKVVRFVVFIPWFPLLSLHSNFFSWNFSGTWTCWNSMNIFNLFSFKTSCRWLHEHPGLPIWICHVLKPKVTHKLLSIFLLLCTSLTLCTWYIKYRFIHFILQVTKKKQSRIMLVDPWNIKRSKKLKLKMKMKTQEIIRSATFVESFSCMNFYLFQIITSIGQSVTFNSRISSH